MKKLLIFGILIVLISANFFPNPIGESTFLDNSCCLENDGFEDFYSNQYLDDYEGIENRVSINNWKYKEKMLFSNPVKLNFEEEFSNSEVVDDPPNIIWSKVYEYGQALSVQQTSDDGYILCGISGEDATLIKTDKNGSAEWIKHLGAEYGDEAYCAIECTDGGYLCTGGDGYIPKDGLMVTFLIKTDEDGNELWYKTYRKHDREGSSLGMSVIEMLDGYVILAGLASYGTTERSTPWLIKTDKNGNEMWNRTYGGGSPDWGNCLILAKDGGFVIVGDTASFDIGGIDAWLLKTDSEGNELWNKSYGGYSYDMGYEVIQTAEGGFVIVGGYTPGYEGWGDLCLIKTDDSGNTEWLRHYGGTDQDRGFSVTTTDDGGYAVVGMKHSGLSSFQGWMLKTDGNGNKLWEEIIGGRPNKIIRSNDGNYVIAGLNNGVWLLKIEDFENNRPAKPTHVYNENTFQLAVSSTDPDGDKIRYGISWYNNSVVDKWTDYYDSGEEGRINCFGKDKPAYVIAEDEHGGQSEWVVAKAKDVFDAESDWAALEVSMPKNKAISTPFFSILENHPYMFTILRHILKL